MNYSLQSLKYLAPKVWDLVPQNIKNWKPLNAFKTHLKSWYSNQSPCRLCETYIAQVGFI